MSKEKIRLIIRTFVMSAFSYFPLIWMFRDKGIHAKINQFYERGLSIAYRELTSSFYSSAKSTVPCHRKLSNSEESKSLLYERNFRLKRKPFSLRVMNTIYARKPNTASYGLEAISFLGQNLWRNLPLFIKNSQSLKNFREDSKVWSFICKCRLCKNLIVHSGFV